MTQGSNGDTNKDGTKSNSTATSKKEQDDEERLRERLKQKSAEARRRKDSDPETSSKSPVASTKTKTKVETPPSTAASSKQERSRRRKREHRHHGSRDRRHGNHWGRGGPPPPQEWRGRGPPPPEWRGRGPPPQHWRVGPPRGGGGVPPFDWRGGPSSRGGGPPRGGHWGGGGPVYDRRRGNSPPRDYHRGRSRSRSRSRSYSSSVSRSSSRSRSWSSRSTSSSRSRYSSRSRSADSREKSRGLRSHSYSDESDASSVSSQSSEERKISPSDALTKDQRTVFLSQLVMRTTEKDIKKYFNKQVGTKVNEVILLRDKRTNRHKGIAYVELRKLEDVPKAVAVSGQAPDFQRFPILVKASEAEKNYIPGTHTVGTASGPIMGPDGKLYEAQKVYVGNLDRSITSEQVYAIFCHYGQLDKVSLQMDMAGSRGFVFLSFRDPKSANLAIQAMSGQQLAGRALKTGWASQTSTAPNVEVRTSDEFPEDAAVRIQNAQVALAQLQASGYIMPTAPGTAVPVAGNVTSVAEAALNAAFGGAAAPAVVAPAVAPPTAPIGVPALTATSGTTTAATAATATTVEDPKVVRGTPSKHILVHNMFDKDQETEEGWEEDIRLDFEEECSKYGIDTIKVMSQEAGGKIYASFKNLDGAKTCALSLAGRWFDKRQLKVEYVDLIPQ